MRQLSSTSRSYLLGCYLAGLLALGWLVWGRPSSLPPAQEWGLAVGLTIVAATCRLFAVAGASPNVECSHDLTPAPIFAALLLLPRPLSALVLVTAMLPEWYFRRRLWYVQLGHIASYLVAAGLAHVMLQLFTGIEQLSLAIIRYPGGVLLVVLAFLLIKSLLSAVVLTLTCGQSFQQSWSLAPPQLFVEIALICVGLGFAIAWLIHPIYGLLAGLPLFLIFQALHVPELKEHAATDPKTGLANMRYFNQVIARDLERSQRNGQPFSLLMCDLDYLCGINSTYGHQAGDEVLRGVANCIRRHIRSCDLGARCGGEEFVVLLADTDATGARLVAERLRQGLAQERIEVNKHRDKISATVSIGVASFPQDGHSVEMLMHEVDLAMFQAKREGRNRVVAAGRESRRLAGEWARNQKMLSLSSTTVERTGLLGLVWRSVSGVARTEGAHRLHPSRSFLSTARRLPERRRRIRRRSDPTPAALLLSFLVCGLGLLALAPLLLDLVQDFQIRRLPWWPLIMFAALTMFAEQLAIDVFGRGKTSVGAVAVLSATLLYGGLGILATALAATLSMKLKAPGRLYRTFFNFGTILLSAEGANLVFRLLVGPTISAVSIDRMLLPAALAGLAYYAINHALLSLIRGLTERRATLMIWRTEYGWLAPHYAVLGVLGLVVALGYLVYGISGVLALMAPVAMMHLAIKQYVNSTAGYVDELRRSNNRLADSYESTLRALTRALDTRDEETEEHSQRVKRYAELIAKRLGYRDAEIEDWLRGALLHDIGKIGVPDAILLKPGRLTQEEIQMMRQHPDIGYGMIAHIPFLAKAAEVVLHHHEAYDGTGYPSQLAGERIPLGARIFAVADSFDAMTSDRPYRRALPLETALAEIKRCRGSQFDPKIVDAFLTIPIDELRTVLGDREIPLQESALGCSSPPRLRQSRQQDSPTTSESYSCDLHSKSC